MTKLGTISIETKLKRILPMEPPPTLPGYFIDPDKRFD